jgi:hypothetical protein
MTRSNVSKMVEAAGERAGLAPHRPTDARRCAAAYAGERMAHDTRRLQLWLGHVDIKHTAHYSELSAKPFKEFWK